MNILLVDHTEIYRNILTQALMDYREFSLVFANTGVEALELAESRDFQFVIVTQHLSDYEGIDLIRRLRSSGKFLYEPMTLLTSSPTAKLSEEAQLAGVTEVFRKHDIQELVNFLRRFLSVYSPLPGRVLYIEDTKSQRMVLEAQLCEWGMHVDTFAAAEDAWQAYLVNDYDLIICDIVLSGRMSGSRFVNRVRRLSGYKGDVLILALTAYDSASRRIELFHLGIDDYVGKPIIPLELRARIQNMLWRKFAADRTRKVLEATGLGVIVVNEHGQIQLFNVEAEKLFGLSESEALDHHMSELISGFGSANEQCFVDRYQSMHRLSGDQQVRWDANGISNNGETFPIQVAMTEIAKIGGSRQFAITVRDVTEERQLSSTLLHAKEVAEAANRLKSDFLANMSHEIRTPMNAIIGLSHLCLQTELTPKQQDYLLKANQAAKSLLGIINDILDLSKIEAGKLEMECVPFVFREILGSLTAFFSIKVQEKKLELLLNVAPGIPAYLEGDPLRLGQVLTNLVGNAIKFTEQGRIVVIAEQEQEAPDYVVLRFTVQDTGIGMTAEQVERLFQAFSQADTSITRKYGGTGLGLTISKRLVEMMGGTIWVESLPGEGTSICFTARFGKHAEVVGTMNIAEDVHYDVVISADSLNGAHLLLVEDNEVNQQVARELLERLGISVTVAENGEEALARLQEDEFDGVLMDMQMPVMDGITATQEIRKLERFQALPIIAMTANAMMSDQEKCLAAGMNGYIAKPIDPDKMLVTLAKWIVPAHPASAPVAPGRQRPSQDALPDLPGVKVAEGVRRMGGNVATYYAILEKFRCNQAQVTEDIRAALVGGEREKAERLAHTLKGLLATLGAETIRPHAEILEKCLGGQPDVPDVETLLRNIAPLLAELLGAIDLALLNREASVEAASLPVDQLQPLLAKAKQQLEEFDAAIEETMQQLLRITPLPSGLSDTLNAVAKLVSAYDYEAALSQLVDGLAGITEKM